MSIRLPWPAVAAALALAATPALAQPRPPAPLFAADAPLHLAIRGPIDAVAGSKAPLDATLTVVGGPAVEALPVQLSARGITRRQHEICPFPPLRVDFAARPADTSPFAHQKSLKLVTHCRPAAGFQQYLLLEYAAYRIYALLTPASFATRLATIDYIDRNGRAMTTRYGFFIEDIKDVAKRSGLKTYKTSARVPPAYLSGADAARAALFEAMIGNLDWSMVAGPKGARCCHNFKLISDATAPGRLVPVPHDYDFAGLVDAPYATPPDGIGVASVRERRYRGYCRNGAEATAAAADLVGQRQAILGVLDAVPGLDDGRRRKAKAYLAGFLDQIATPSGLAKLTATCVN